MKKYIFTLICVLFCGAAAFAGDKLNVKSGSLTELKDGGTATVVIDMTKTTYDKKMPLRQDSRYANIDNQMSNFTSEFIREYNENSKKFKLTDGKDAPYSIKVIVDDLDFHVNVMSFKGSMATEIEGTIEIYKNGTEKVADLQFQHESSSFTFELSLEETLEGLAKNLAKKVNKGK